MQISRIQFLALIVLQSFIAHINASVESLRVEWTTRIKRFKMKFKLDTINNKTEAALVHKDWN